MFPFPSQIAITLYYTPDTGVFVNRIHQKILAEFEKTRREKIESFGSYEAWNIAILGQYGLTADELMNLSIISSYGTVLPTFIFGEKGDKISDEEALDYLSNSVQFMYSVYYFQTGEDVEEQESTDDESSKDEEFKTVEEYNKYYEIGKKIINCWIVCRDVHAFE